MNATIDKMGYMPEETECSYLLKASMGYIIPPGKSRNVKTGINIAVPKGVCAILKNVPGDDSTDLLVLGVMNPGYTGAINVKIKNNGDSVALIKRGTKIAELVFLTTTLPKIEIVGNLDE